MHDLVVIDPVTRIEGHAKITIALDDAGAVADARFHVTEFRGFEEFCKGRPVWEMPSLTARTCGICPVSHLLASAKTGDAIMGVRIPPTAVKLRRIANLGQIIQSHALSFFHLSAPDLLLGMDADPAIRNVFGLMASEPELARRGIRLRSFGQSVIEAIAGRKVHSPGIVPGGIAQPMTGETRDRLREALVEARQTAEDAVALFTGMLDQFDREVGAFGSFPSLHMGLANDAGTWEHYDGHLKIVDADGAVVVDRCRSGRVPDHHRRGGAARLVPEVAVLQATGFVRRRPGCGHVSRRTARPAQRVRNDGGAHRRRGPRGVPGAGGRRRQLVVLLSLCRGSSRSSPPPSTWRDLLGDPGITDAKVRATAGINRFHAVGASEAPRGTLFHEYTVDEHGILTDVNMIIATGQNNLAMNATVLQIAREWIDGPTIPEGILNRVEAGIRAFDPCLSCSTHAIGQMPLVVELVGPDGETVCRVQRD